MSHLARLLVVYLLLHLSACGDSDFAGHCEKVVERSEECIEELRLAVCGQPDCTDIAVQPDAQERCEEGFEALEGDGYSGQDIRDEIDALLEKNCADYAQATTGAGPGMPTPVPSMLSGDAGTP